MYCYKIEEWQIISKYKLNWAGTLHPEINLDASKNAFVFEGEKQDCKMRYHLNAKLYKLNFMENIDTLYDVNDDINDDINEGVLFELLKRQNVVALNVTAFQQYYKVNIETLASKIVQYLDEKTVEFHKKKRVHLLGLGDVGSTLTIGLKLLGEDSIETIGIYDLNENMKKRWEMELNQITACPDIRVEAICEDELFDCDVFVFCASKTVPKVGDEVKDVRLIQFKENAKIIGLYGKKARDCEFKGVFAVVSDPVDLLCKAVYDSSNRNQEQKLDYKGLLPEQVRGFGLGVMDGRAKYYSNIQKSNYAINGRVFGPHGSDLVVADDIENYNHEESMLLSDKVIHSNLEMRALGYKPYVAPAISSGAKSIVDMILGKWHYSATYVNNVFWGSKNRETPEGIEMEQIVLNDQLKFRINKSYRQLEESWEELK